MKYDAKVALFGSRADATDDELLARFVELFNRGETHQVREFATRSAEEFGMLERFEARIDRSRPLCKPPPPPPAKRRRW